MKQFLLKSAAFILLAYGISYGVYYALKMFEERYYSTSMKTRWASALTDKHVDYVFLGSSRMANMIACHQLDSTLHTTSVNLATAGSSYGENFVLLHEFIQNGNTGKTLILSFDLFKSRHMQYDKEALTPLVFKQFELFPTYQDPVVREVYKAHTSQWKICLWDYIPFSRYVEFNSYFKADTIFSSILHPHKQRVGFDTLNGEQLIEHFTVKELLIAAPGNIQLGPRGWIYLQKILTLAKRQHMKIILITAPYYRPLPFYRNDHNKYLTFLKEQYQAQYFDFSKEDDWKNAACFSDAIHTNADGSRLFTQMLSDSLRVMNTVY